MTTRQITFGFTREPRQQHVRDHQRQDPIAQKFQTFVVSAPFTNAAMGSRFRKDRHVLKVTP